MIEQQESLTCAELAAGARSSVSLCSALDDFRAGINLTRREVCVGILLRVFSRTAPILGEVVKKTLSCVHGADRWSAEVHNCLTKRMARVFDKDPYVLGQDMFVITEVLIDKADELLPVCCRRGYRGIELENFVLGVDCVSLARTRLFHTRGSELTGNEVYRCLLSLQETCTALGIVKTVDNKLPSVSPIDLNEKMEVSFFLGLLSD